MKSSVFILIALLCFASHAAAHESRPGYLEIREITSEQYDVLWKQPARGEKVLSLTPVLPESCTEAGNGKTEKAPGALLTRNVLDCKGGLRGKTIRIDGLEATLTDVLVRVYYKDGASETHMLRPVSTSVTISGSSGGERALSYLSLGFEHILMGVDHLLFVLGLLLIVRNRWMLIKTISSFTIAHSITLAIATLGYASAPVPPLNAAIALSILFLGPEIIRAQRGETSITIRRPWIVAFAFGLLHGFGFASGLTTMGLPDKEIPLALLLFNIGVELGQLLFVLVIVMLERSFHTLEIRWPRPAKALPAYTVGSLGAYWTIQRTFILLGGMK